MKNPKELKEESTKGPKTPKHKTTQTNSDNANNNEKIKELQKEHESLIAEIENLKELNAEHEDFIKRQKAEFDNYRKRVQEEKVRNIEFAGEGIMKSFITIYDNYSKALQVEVKHEEVKAFLEGFKIIKNEMDKFMDEQKVSLSTKVGDDFDPNIHQAILFDESKDVEVPSVTEVFQEGYMMSGRLLRTAMVKVTKPLVEDKEEKNKEETISSVTNKNTEIDNKK